MSATTTPINRVDCMRSPCATLDGAKPSCATASWTRALSGALTKLVPLMTFETVAVDTRARRATSLIVGFGKVRLGVGSREREPWTIIDRKSLSPPFQRRSSLRFRRGRRLAPRSIAIAFVFVLIGGRSVADLYRDDLGQRGLVQLVAFHELGRRFH